MLHVATPAATIRLSPHSVLTLGRADCPHVPGAAAVSRRAVTLAATGPRRATLTVVGKSACRLISRVTGETIILPPGAVRDDVGVGDEVQLAAAAPEAVVRVCDDAAARLEPPPKRPRGGVEDADGAPVPPPPTSPLMLVLCGLPGAGKSTLASALAAAGWTRICQDTISPSGRRGTRAACVTAAKTALAAGRRVVIDRCNATVEQRADFIAAAASAAAPVHALHLALPAAACADRAAGRASHEGGVCGQGARAVVARVAAAGVVAPARTEGFASVTVCTNDRAANAAAARWAGREESKPANAFDVLMAAARSPKPPPPPPPTASRSLAGPLNALRAVAANPASNPAASVTQIDGFDLIILPDRYPKARRHALVLPFGAPGAAPDTPAALATWPNAAALVRAMLTAGKRWAAGAGDTTPWRFGFHSVPSLAPLHLHCITQDLISPALKTKKHFHSFASPFFVDAIDVVDALDTGGPLPLLDGGAAAAALAAPLVCHRCGAAAPNMPRLKEHLAVCDGPWPASAERV